MLVRLYKKVSRNDLCPCGSGKKLKNCTCEDQSCKNDMVDLGSQLVYRGEEILGKLKDKEDEVN